MLELNNIYNVDCITGMKLIDDNSIDLVVTDPPYLMNYRSNRRVTTEKFNHINNDKSTDAYLIPQYLEQLYRVMKDNTAIYMFCSWHHIDVFKQEFDKLFKLKNIIVWNKNNHGSGDLKASYAPKHEFILFGNKGRSLFRGKRLPDVIDCPKVLGGVMMHPTEKPTDLLSTFIINSSDCGNIVLDPFMGSGSTAIACLNTNRKYIGFEMDKGYYDIANNRIMNT